MLTATKTARTLILKSLTRQKILRRGWLYKEGVLNFSSPSPIVKRRCQYTSEVSPPDTIDLADYQEPVYKATFWVYRVLLLYLVINLCNLRIK